MTDVNSSPPPAGWYPDPAGSNRTRWWNGFGWSDTYGEPIAPTAPADVPVAAPAVAPGYPAAPVFGNAPAYSAAATYGSADLKAPEGTSPYTPFIWALALLPVIGLIDSVYSLVTFDQIVSDALDPNAPIIAPRDLISGAVGWLVIGLSVLFGILDWRALKKAGVPQPFHWAWIFFSVIGAPVYMIGRSIIVRRRVAPAFTPMVINLVLVVVNFTLGVVAAVLAVGSVFDSGLIP